MTLDLLPRALGATVLAAALCAPAFAPAQGAGDPGPINNEMEHDTREERLRDRPGEFAQNEYNAAQPQVPTVNKGVVLPPAVEAQVFSGKGEPFTARGEVVDASESELTIAREGLPDLTLTVLDRTEIEVDGKWTPAAAIEPGTEVRAEFQLAQDRPVALSVEGDKKAEE